MEQEEQHSAEAPSFSPVCPLALVQLLFLHNICAEQRLMMTKILFLKPQQKQSLFRELWASTAALWGFWLVGQVEPGCEQTLSFDLSE